MKKLKYGMFAVLFSLLFSCGEDTQEPEASVDKNVTIEFSATGDYDRFQALFIFTFARVTNELEYIEPLISPDSLILDLNSPGDYTSSTLDLDNLISKLTVNSSVPLSVCTFGINTSPTIDATDDTDYSFSMVITIKADGEIVETIEFSQNQNEVSKTTSYTENF